MNTTDTLENKSPRTRRHEPGQRGENNQNAQSGHLNHMARFFKQVSLLAFFLATGLASSSLVHARSFFPLDSDQPPPIYQLPFVEDFDGLDNGLPPGWTAYDANQDGITWETSGEKARSGQCAFYSFNPDKEAWDWLVSPALYLDKAATLEFFYRVRTDVNPENLSVYLSTSGNDIMALQEFPLYIIRESVLDEYQKISIDLSDFQGETVHIGFLVHSEKNRYGIYIDDLSVVSCHEPVSARIQAVEEHSALVEHENPSGEAIISYRKVPGDTAEANQPVNFQNVQSGLDGWQSLHSLQSPAVLPGLQSNTGYQVLVRSLCPDQDTSSATELRFKTACGLQTLPFRENFNFTEEGGIPECWDNSSGSETHPGYRWHSVYDHEWNGLHSSGNYMMFDSKLSKTGKNNYLRSPFLHISRQTKLQLSFRYVNTEGHKSISPSILAVYLTRDAGRTYDTLAHNLYNGRDWADTVFELELRQNRKTGTKEVEIQGGNQLQVVFEAVSNFGFGIIGIDNVQVRTPASCSRPYDLTVSGIEAHEAVLSWKSGASAHKISYYPADAPKEIHSIPSLENPVRLENLESGTEYEIRLAAVCPQGDTSDESLSRFSTGVCNHPVQEIQVLELTASTARLDWGHDREDEYTYRVRYQAASGSSRIQHCPQSEIVLENLEPGSRYQVDVHAICPLGDTSQAVSTHFSTPCPVFSLPYAENFENLPPGELFPPCWEEEILVPHATADYYWSVGNSGIEAFQGGNYLYFFSFALGRGTQTRVLTPSLQSAPCIELSFQHYRQNQGYNDEKMIVGYTDERYPGEYFPIDTIDQNLPDSLLRGWYPYTYRIPAFPQGRIYFEAIGDKGSNIFVDALEINPIHETDLQIGLSRPRIALGDCDSLGIGFKLTNTGVSDFQGPVQVVLRNLSPLAVSPDSLILCIDFKTNPLTAGQSRFSVFGSKIALEEYGTFEFELSLKAEGEVATGNNQTRLQVEHYKALEAPMSFNFKHVDSTEPWFSCFDLNQDGLTWERQEQAYHCPPNPQNASDDLLLLPALHLEPGLYAVDALVGAQDRILPEGVALYLFPGNIPASLPSMEELTSSLLEAGQELVSKEFFFFPQIPLADTISILEEGVYYFGFHARSHANKAGLNAYEFRLQETGSSHFIDTSICQGEIYLFHGQELSQSGLYEQILQNEEGIDSLVVLKLEVHPNYLFELDTVICHGTSVFFGGKEYKESGRYDEFYLSSSGCDSIYSLHLEVLPPASAPVIDEREEDGKKILFSNQTRNQWYKDDQPMENETGMELRVTSNGIYHATSRNSCGESGPSNRIEIRGLANQTKEEAPSLRIYPNPARDILYIQNPGLPLEQIEIFNMKGQLVHRLTRPDAQTGLPVSDWPAGLYLIKADLPGYPLIFKVEITE